MAASLSSAITRLLVVVIKLYRLVLSPLLGQCCRFSPSCSEYAIQALRRFGTLKGGWLTLKRLLKCSPLNLGGDDPVPPMHTNNPRVE